jgi:hypothetical protein
MNENDIITLEPIRGADGLVWAEPDASTLSCSGGAGATDGADLTTTTKVDATDLAVCPTPPPADVVIGSNGGLSLIADAQDPQPLSTIPRERMAAGWQEVFAQVRDLENGGGPELAVQPGGGITVKHEGHAEQPVSVVPSVRMAADVAAAAASITTADAEELSRLDPENLENWTPVTSSGGEFSGWLFELRPPYQDQPFKFLTFRNPSRRNEWDVASIAPNLDRQFGHAPHMITTVVGGRKMPIICGPGGEPSPSLTVVRGVAAKWMYYTSARMAGVNPGFSL